MKDRKITDLLGLFSSHLNCENDRVIKAEYVIMKKSKLDNNQTA